MTIMQLKRCSCTLYTYSLSPLSPSIYEANNWWDNVRQWDFSDVAMFLSLSVFEASRCSSCPCVRRDQKNRVPRRRRDTFHLWNWLYIKSNLQICMPERGLADSSSGNVLLWVKWLSVPTLSALTEWLVLLQLGCNRPCRRIATWCPLSGSVHQTSPPIWAPLREGIYLPLHTQNAHTILHFIV